MTFNVIHIITGLLTGGAETMLYKLLSGMDYRRFQNTVISLTDRGQIAGSIEKLGIPVHVCGMTPGRFTFQGFYKLVLMLRKLRPDIVQTWLYHADLLGGLAAKVALTRAVVWNIRHSNFDHDKNKRHTLWIARINGLLSDFIAVKFICNSYRAAQIHQQIGFKSDRFVIIPNGFDTDKFRPNMESRLSVRRELGAVPVAPIVGLIARYDPLKNHLGFIEAAAVVAQQRNDIHFLLAGTGVDKTNSELCQWIDTMGLKGKVHLLGRRTDVSRLTAALDVAVCCSWGEGFPNVVGEAMACGVPCVVTDVGECAEIVGDTGQVVLPGDMENLAQKIISVLELPTDRRNRLCADARNRITQHYSLSSIINQYQKLYQSLRRKTF